MILERAGNSTWLNWLLSGLSMGCQLHSEKMLAQAKSCKPLV